MAKAIPRQGSKKERSKTAISRTLFIDIETSPLISYTWGIYETDVVKVIKPWHLLSVAYKWLGGATRVVALSDFKSNTDKELTRFIHKLLDEADIVIAHNGDSFDIPRLNTRFLVHGLKPPSPFKTIDTRTVAKRKFAFSSNKLNDLGIDLSEGEKLKHRGFEMWEKCLAGDRQAWKDMKRYNKKDVDLLERIYLRMRPWINNHPAVGPNCVKCNGKLHKKGTRITKKKVIQRYQCQSCGGWE